MKKIKTVTGYTALARYMASLVSTDGDVADVVGYVVNRQEVATPYSYSPTRSVYQDDAGRLVVILETAHRRYEVFQMDAATVHATEDAAEAAFLAPRVEA